MLNIGQGFELLVDKAKTPEARRGDGAAVIGILPGDNNPLVGLVLQIPIAPHQTNIGVIGLGAGVGEKYMSKAFGRHIHQALGELNRRRIAALKKIIVVGQLLKLTAHRFGNGRLAITETTAPEAGHAVEYLIVVCVIDVDMFGAVNDSPGLFRVLVKVGKGVQVTLGVELLPLLGRSVFSHDNCGRRIVRARPDGGFVSGCF